MVTLTQRVLLKEGETTTLIDTLTHIFAPTGTFRDKQDRPAGWHIQLGTYDSADNYTEYPDPATPHEVPDAMPDIIIIPEDETDPEAEAEAADYESALRDMGVNIPDTEGGDDNEEA